MCSPVSSSTYQLTPLPSLPHTLSYPYPLLLIELVHLLPCLLLSHVCSPCLLVNLSTYPITLSSITINLSTCLLVNLSTYPITLSSSYPVIPLSPVTHRTCSSVTLSFIAPRVFPLSPRQPINLPHYPVFYNN